MRNSEREPNLLKRALGPAALAVGMVIAADHFGFIDVNIGGPRAQYHVDVHNKQPDVIKITPVDFGSFVNVQSSVEVTGHQRRILSLGPIHKTTRTNTTTKQLVGDAELSVNNKYTEITAVRNGEMRVAIGELEVHRPRVTEQETHSGVAFSQRLNDIVTNGSDKRDEIADKLVEIGTDIIGQAACIDKATDIAEQQIQKHYQKIGAAFGIAAEDVHITYKEVPHQETAPEGRLTTEEEKYWDLPDSLDVDVSPLTCDAAVIEAVDKTAGHAG